MGWSPFYQIRSKVLLLPHSGSQQQPASFFSDVCAQGVKEGLAVRSPNYIEECFFSLGCEKSIIHFGLRLSEFHPCSHFIPVPYKATRFSTQSLVHIFVHFFFKKNMHQCMDLTITQLLKTVQTHCTYLPVTTACIYTSFKYIRVSVLHIFQMIPSVCVFFSNYKGETFSPFEM